MKKFFSIAAIVLMAALLVVSCANEAKTSDLINAMVSSNGVVGRVMGADKPVADYYTYKLEYLSANGGEAGYGATESGKSVVIASTFNTSGNFKLGTISQGLWRITIDGFVLNIEDAENKTKYTAPTAETTITDSDWTSKATKVCSGTITSNIDQAHATFSLTIKAFTGNGKLAMSGVTASGTDATSIEVWLSGAESAALTVTGVAHETGTSTGLYDYTTFTDATGATVAAGSYSATIKVYNGTTLVASQAVALTILPGQTTTITGTTDAAKFLTPAGSVDGVVFTGTLAAGDNNAFVANTDNKGKVLSLAWTSNGQTKATHVSFYLNGEKSVEIGSVDAKADGSATWSGTITIGKVDETAKADIVGSEQYTITAVAYSVLADGTTIYTSANLAGVYYIL